MASDLSTTQLAPELEDVMAQLVSVTGTMLERCGKLSAIEADSDQRVEELPVVQSARVLFEVLVRSNVGHSVAVLDAFINHVGTPLVDRFCTGLGRA